MIYKCLISFFVSNFASKVGNTRKCSKAVQQRQYAFKSMYLLDAVIGLSFRTCKRSN